jgi:hypothetical protein
MRNTTKNRVCFAVQALAAAWLIAWAGVPSARGDQNPSPTVTAFGAFPEAGFPDHGLSLSLKHWPIPSPPSGPIPIPYPNIYDEFHGQSWWQNKSWPTSRPTEMNPWPKTSLPTTPCPTTPPPSNLCPGKSSDTDTSGHPGPCSRPASVSTDPIIQNPPTGPFMFLGSTADGGTTSLGSITMVGSNGSYVAQTITVTGAAQSAGALTVNGFNPSNDEEIYGLDATTTNLATLISELNTAVGIADSGAVAEAVPANLASVLSGDNIAVIFPNNGVTPTNIFSYNLTGDTTNASITSITVVPEPAVATCLVFGVAGIFGRRRRGGR